MTGTLTVWPGAPLKTRTALSLGLAAMLSFSLAPQAAAARQFASDDIAKLLEALHSGALTAEAASSECLLKTAAATAAETLRELLSTYLEVSRSNALPRFCDALVEAAQEGSIDASDLTAIAEAEDKESEAYAFGRLLRVIYFTHNDLSPTLLLGDTRR